MKEYVVSTSPSINLFGKSPCRGSAATPHQTGSSCLDLCSSSAGLKDSVLGDLGDCRHPQQHHPGQVPHVRAAQAAVPLLLLGKCQFGFPLHCLFQAWLFFLSFFWREEKGGRGTIMNIVLYLLFFLFFWSLFLISSFSVRPLLYSSAASSVRGKANPAVVANLLLSASRGWKMYLSWKRNCL